MFQKNEVILNSTGKLKSFDRAENVVMKWLHMRAAGM